MSRRRGARGRRTSDELPPDGWPKWAVMRADGNQVIVGGDEPRRAEHMARGLARALGREGIPVRIGPLTDGRRWMGWEELAPLDVSA